MSAKQKVPAVFKEDLLDLLNAIGEYEQILEGGRFCEICLSPINPDNIQFLTPTSQGKFLYICRSLECVEEYNQLSERNSSG
jgi:hypothetical protein